MGNATQKRGKRNKIAKNLSSDFATEQLKFAISKITSDNI